MCSSQNRRFHCLHSSIKARESHTTLKAQESHTPTEYQKTLKAQKSHTSNKLHTFKEKESHTIKPHEEYNTSNESHSLKVHKSRTLKLKKSRTLNKSRTLKLKKSRTLNKSRTLKLKKSRTLNKSRTLKLKKSRTTQKYEILRANESSSNATEYDEDNCDYENSDKFEMDFIQNWNASDPKNKYLFDALKTTHEYYSHYESPYQSILRNKSREFNQTVPGVDQDPTSYDRKLYKLHNEYLDRLLGVMDKVKNEGHALPARMDLVADEALKFWHTNTSHIHNATALANLDKVPLPVETIDPVSEKALADKVTRLFNKLEGKEKGWEAATWNPNITLDPEWGTLDSVEYPERQDLYDNSWHLLRR
ncbi:hypothetical protein WDU94_002927 [Cyamophila willieti]